MACLGVMIVKLIFRPRIGLLGIGLSGRGLLGCGLPEHGLPGRGLLGCDQPGLGVMILELILPTFQT